MVIPIIGYYHENEFARGKLHVNVIESFWSFAKRRFLTDETFILHLKECECRFILEMKTLNNFLLKSFFKNRDTSLDLKKYFTVFRCDSCKLQYERCVIES